MGVGPSWGSEWSSLWVARTSGASSDLSVGVEVSPLLNSSRLAIANWWDRWRTTAVGGAWHQKAAPERKSSQSDSKWKPGGFQSLWSGAPGTVPRYSRRGIWKNFVKSNFCRAMLLLVVQLFISMTQNSKTQNVNYSGADHQKDNCKDKEKDKYAMLRLSGIKALTPMSCKHNSKALPVTSLPFCPFLSHMHFFQLCFHLHVMASV